MEDLIINVNGKEHKVKVEETSNGKIRVHHEGKMYEVETRTDIEPIITEDTEKTSTKTKQGEGIIKAPIPGKIISIEVKKGKKVKQGDTLLKLVAMKMENEIVSPKEGTIKEIRVKKNADVNKGDVLIVIE